MKDKWQLLSDKYMALSMRERGIVAATVLVLVLVLWLQLVFVPFEKSQKSARSGISKANEDIVAFTEKASQLEIQLRQNPNDPLRKEQARLKSELDELANEIELRLAHLLAPKQMAELLQEVLADYSGLTLVKAYNLPAEPLVIKSASLPENAIEHDADQSAIYEHGFEMQLEGSYFETVEFLKRLEEMDGFYWQTIDYQVEEHPQANITIRLNTLSLEEDWIGV